MNTKFTIEQLAAWIKGIKQAAKEDATFSIAWFPMTQNLPFSIVAGWQEYFTNDDYSDVFCCSKSQPKYVMCLKVAENKGPYAYIDFDAIDMPVDKSGEVDDTCIPLEWDDSPKAAAFFFMGEWERIMKEHEEEI